MRILVLLTVLGACAAPRAAVIADGDALDPGEHGPFSVPGWPDREYILHVPGAYDGSSAAVVYAFHGGGSDKDGVDRTRVAWRATRGA